MDLSWAQASEIVAAVGSGRMSAREVVGAALARVAQHDRRLNAFTAVVEDRALAKAAAIDAARARGCAVRALAVAGGLVPLALGSDTNGSIRVPASLCGIFGLKPTYGRLSRAGAFPFVASLDHVGPLARSARDLALAYDSMQGYDRDDPVCADRAPEPVTPLLGRGSGGLRIAVAAGYFRIGAFPEAQSALERVVTALGAKT